MRDRSRVSPFITGVITAAVMVTAMTGVIISGMPSSPLASLPWNHHSTLRVQLADADALAPHAGVQIAGVKVGEVKSVEADGTRAVATLSIDPAYFDVHQDARVALRPHGLFGPKYVDLIPGSVSTASLHDGDTIQVQQTVQPVDLDQILKALQAPEQQNLKTAITEMGKAAAGRGDDANHLLAAANQLSAALDTPVRALDNVAPNLSDLLVRDEQFNDAFSQTPLDQLVANNAVVMHSLADNAGHLQSLVAHADAALTTLDASLNGEGGDIHAILETAPGTIDRLNQFNKLLGLFAANLTGKDTSVPNDSDVTNGIIAAIENPKSAFASSDPCTPGPNHCGPDGRAHYLRVQVFNLGGSGNGGSTQGYPLCLTKIVDGLPGIPSSIPCPAPAPPGANSAADIGSLVSMLGA
jgi:virulence factor Mce-like protein